MLPILEQKDDLLKRLAEHRLLVLSSPTGSGKSTQIPQFLTELSGEGKILVLQPRRLAARVLAERVAHERHGSVGDEVGYQVKQDNRTATHTRIIYMTEGVLLRQLHNNAQLKGIDWVVMDEFHERNWQTDFLLAYLKKLKKEHPDFGLVVMSATLDSDGLDDYLLPLLPEGSTSDDLICRLQGRQFPVEISYRDFPISVPTWEQAGKACKDLWFREKEGDVLIFMSGVYEIRRCMDVLASFVPRSSLYPLYSALPKKEQNQALQTQSHRKIIIATNVAETSLTIEGVRHVIDSGLVKMSRYDNHRSLTILQQEPISVSSSDQRAGRAGRVAAGTCLRLWSKSQQSRRPLTTEAELHRSDVAEILLQLLALDIENVWSFDWLEPIAEDKMHQAFEVLTQLDALNEEGCLTKLGQNLAQLPMALRLGRVLIEASKQACTDLACLAAALMSEKSILPKKDWRQHPLNDGFDSDLQLMIRCFEQAKGRRFDLDFCRRNQIHAQSAREVDRAYEHFQDIALGLGLSRNQNNDLEHLQFCLLKAYPDRLAVRRDKGSLSCRLSRGRSASLSRESVARDAQYLLALDFSEIHQAGKTQTLLTTNVSFELSFLLEHFGSQIAKDKGLVWNDAKSRADQMERLTLGDLVLFEKESQEIDLDRAGEILAEQFIAGNLKFKNWDKEVKAWIDRVRFVADLFPEKDLPIYDEEDMEVIIHEMCSGSRRFKDVKDIRCIDYLKNALSWDEQRFIDEMTPERLKLPSGKRMRMTYKKGEKIQGRAFIADLFGLEKTPQIAGGRAKILFEILAPNHRPIQMTEDLESFWKDLYPQLKKELSRRYPKHKWL